jgi:drug/metabolite transporter (DMT)-like permease
MKLDVLELFYWHFFVTFLWSTSWILFRLGLNEIPLLVFVGIRYSLTFLVLLPFFFVGRFYRQFSQVAKNEWKKLIWLGLLFYLVAQGTQFIGLKILPTMTVSLISSLQPLMVTFKGILALAEKPNSLQLFGMILNLAGILVFLGITPLHWENLIVFFIVFIGRCGDAASTILGRALNRQKKLSPLFITTVSMGNGS